MCGSLWRSIKKSGESLRDSEIPTFLMANRQESGALGRVDLLLTLHDVQVTVSVHVLSDDKLRMPLLLGLDFMCASQTILVPHLLKYILPGGKEYRFLPKARNAQQWSPSVPAIIFTWQ